MATKTKRIEAWATTGTEASEYGSELPVLRIATEPHATTRQIAAATYRAAAAIEERLNRVSTCAVCVDPDLGRVHLEFAARIPPREQLAARAVLDQVAGEINRRANAA